MSKKSEWIFLLIILVIAVFVRLWQLDLIPPGLYPDVAINGNDALEILKTGNFKVFYPENNGREGLFMWLIAASFSIFGVSIWSIKIVAAIIGILTVLGLYLLVKEIFEKTNNQQSTINKEAVALLSSFFLAVSFWHINFSRIGFRAILLPFILVFSFYFLFRGFRTQRIKDVIIAGIFFGLGFYTYTSFRIAVLLLLIVLICWWFIYRKQVLQKKYFFLVSCFLCVTFIIALPIGIYFLQHPQDFIGRVAPISIFAAENPSKEFGKSFILHLGMLNFHGDSNWRHNFSGSPMLPWSLGILFLIGIIFSFKELINFKNHKNWSLAISYWLLVIWFFVMLLPGILTYEGIPHALRVIGIIPVVYIFIGIGGWWAYEKLKQIIKNKKLFLVICLLFLIVVASSEFNKYFISWAKNPNVEGAFTKKFAEIGYYLNSLPQNTQKYVIVNEAGVPVPWPDGIPMPAQTPMFIESIKSGQPKAIYLKPQDLDKIQMPIVFKGEIVIVPMKYDENLLKELETKFPQGQIKKINEISVYEIK